jgi:hypothetical protein
VLSRFILTFVAAGLLHTVGAQVVETSEKEDTTGMPRIVFFRPAKFVGNRGKVAVYCDLTKVAVMRNNTFFEIALSPGTHLCSTEVVTEGDSGGSALNSAEYVNQPSNISLEVKPGAKQWVSVRLKLVGMTHNTFLLTSENPADAAKEMHKKGVKPVKPDEQSVRQISRTPAGSPVK